MAGWRATYGSASQNRHRNRVVVMPLTKLWITATNQNSAGKTVAVDETHAVGGKYQLP